MGLVICAYVYCVVVYCVVVLFVYWCSKVKYGPRKVIWHGCKKDWLSSANLVHQMPIYPSSLPFLAGLLSPPPSWTQDKNIETGEERTAVLLGPWWPDSGRKCGKCEGASKPQLAAFPQTSWFCHPPLLPECQWNIGDCKITFQNFSF